MEKMLAIFCSDIHFSDRTPACREKEKNWFEAMFRPWYQLINEIPGVAKRGSGTAQVPIIICGDVFDRWSPSYELTNAVIDLFKAMNVWAIPGQHDLRNHAYEDRHKTAYGSLVLSGAINDLTAITSFDGFHVHPFPWGYELKPNTVKSLFPEGLHVAVAHKYIWMGDHKYEGAENVHLGVGDITELFEETYDAAFFGDNHKGFQLRAAKGLEVMNCGSFYRRHKNEKDYEPRVGALWSSGRVESIPLDTSQDEFRISVEREDETAVLDFDMLMQELEQLGDDDALDYQKAVTELMDVNAISDEVRKVVMEALERDN